MRVLINGVGYDTFSGEYEIFATLPKRLRECYHTLLQHGRFDFSDYTFGRMCVFTNRRGIKMISVSGQYRGLNTHLETYLQERRADVTKYINNLP